jgi:hypothetical protein
MGKAFGFKNRSGAANCQGSIFMREIILVAECT